jgi:hypothetical protein
MESEFDVERTAEAFVTAMEIPAQPVAASSAQASNA